MHSTYHVDTISEKEISKKNIFDFSPCVLITALKNKISRDPNAAQ